MKHCPSIALWGSMLYLPVMAPEVHAAGVKGIVFHSGPAIDAFIDMVGQ